MNDTEFTGFTDKLISILKDRGIVPRSSNFIIAKRPVEEISSGGIYIPNEAQEKTLRQTGFGRIVGCPNNADQHYSDIKAGDYVLYNHASHYKPPLEAIRLALGIADFPDGVLYLTIDSEILFTVPAL